MSDISKCTNIECSKRLLCKRVYIQAHEFRQSYTHFVPKKDNGIEFECEFIIIKSTSLTK
jgi:hypothetical protein